MIRSAQCALLVASLLMPILGQASNTFDDVARSLRARHDKWWEIDGALRVRGSVFGNLDLDHGLTPSGQPLFPVSLSDPGQQILSSFDMRLRTDFGIYTPGGSLGIKVRLDVLDNLTFGELPDGHPTATTSQRPADSAIRVKRAWGLALTPIGYIAAGRMGTHWGLGMLSHGGDCDDCDSGDAGDRIAFITSLWGHLWAFSYDFTATGPLRPRDGGGPAVDFDPTDNVHTITFAFMNLRSPLARERRRKAGRFTAEYGAWVSHRWQENDIPADYLPIARPPQLTSAQSMVRDFRATAVDLWLRLTTRSMRLELEAAVVVGFIGQPSLIPGARLRDPIESLQIGVAFESEFGDPDGPVIGGLNLGFASGDPAPGFGATVGPTDPVAVAGDIDGPQAVPGVDNRVDNFRFHPDYRVDRILFREIIGTVTDAIYIRPHLRWRVATIGPGELTFRFAGIFSMAAEPNSTPGGDRLLGVELDPTLSYSALDGFTIAIDYAVLFPLAGLDNRVNGLAARPAQLGRLRLRYAF